MFHAQTAGNRHGDTFGGLTGRHDLAEDGTTEEQQEKFTCKGESTQGTKGIKLQQCLRDQKPIGQCYYQRTNQRRDENIDAAQRHVYQQREANEQAEVSEHGQSL